MKSGKICLTMLFSCALLIGAGFEFQQQGEILVFRTVRTEIKVKNARIIAVRNRENGVELAGEKTPAASNTAGIGNMTGQADQMSKLHFPWGEPLLEQSQKLGKKLTIYRYPDHRSKLTVSREGNRVKAVWTGLTDSVGFYPEDFIELFFLKTETEHWRFRDPGPRR